MSVRKKIPANAVILRYLLVTTLGFGMLCLSTHAFSQTDDKTVKAEQRAEKRKDIKKFFKGLNPFKHKDAQDNSTSTGGDKSSTNPKPDPAPVPAPPPAPSPSNTKQTTAATKKKTKKAVVKKTTTAQPFM